MCGGAQTASATWSTSAEARADSNVGGDIARARSWSASVGRRVRVGDSCNTGSGGWASRKCHGGDSRVGWVEDDGSCAHLSTGTNREKCCQWQGFVDARHSC